LIEFDDFEFEFLFLEIGRVTDGTYVDQRARQEGTNFTDINGKSAFDLAGKTTGNDFVSLLRFLESSPGACTFGFFARQARFTVTIFE
jgi:hypothetical protein